MSANFAPAPDSYYTELAAMFQRAMSDTLGDVALSLEIVDKTRKRYAAKDLHGLSGSYVIAAVARWYDIPPERLTNRMIRGASIAECRWVAMAVMRETGMSYPEIAHALRIHHSTVIHGVRQVRTRDALAAIAAQVLGTIRTPVAQALAAHP